jgi:transcriptional regulator with XRE-family HTH domain
MKNGNFDYSKLAQHILDKRNKEGITLRSMAKSAKVTISTCYRAEAVMGGLSVESVISICNWLGVTVQYFITPKSKTNGKSKKVSKEAA